MAASSLQTPGVYINEVNAFPNSVVAVDTAVPAFIGYTPQASYEGKSYINKPTKVSSLADFQAIYELPDPPAPADPVQQYTPQYYLVAQKEEPTSGDYMLIAGTYYSILPDPNTIYFLYNSIQLFYQNGGGDAYIVSVGTYGAPSGKPMDAPGQIVNPNVSLTDLTGGLELLLNETEPTMYICPEATLLSPDNNGTLMQSMMLQAETMQTAVCLLDIIGGRDPDPITYSDDIDNFRNSTGSNGLDYGTAYYPFVGTTVMQTADLNYTNLFGGDTTQLNDLLNPPTDPNPDAATILGMIQSPPADPLTVSQYNNALTNASSTYSLIIKHCLSDANILPPSGGMAGVYTINDNESGVWNAPANTSIVAVSSLPINLSDSQQAPLNVDAVSGKSINCIRFFNGQGILVWGARTLDGNSQDWRYISVRRTMIMLEQSCKLAARAYVFAPNDANTWGAVKSMIGSFLSSIWAEGGLQGAKASDAYSVDCGLGTTMTSDDILNGIMNVSVKVAVVRPAEFIVITFEQQMAESS